MRTSSWLPCVLTALLAIGCTSESEPPPEPPTATETPTEDEEPADVEGAIEEVRLAELSSNDTGLYAEDSRKNAAVPTEKKAVDAAVAAAAAWLDAHLTDVQSGGPGLVADAGLTGDPALASEGLTDPDHPVTEATYAIVAGVRGAPEWVRVAATVAREDGTMTADFVFIPKGDEVALVAARPGAGDPAVAP